MALKLKESELKELLATLEDRFKKNLHRHKGVDWKKLEAKLRSQADKCRVLFDMEHSGGEPDVVAYEPKTDLYIFMDCAAESPKDRRSWCYDREALDKRQENKPAKTNHTSNTNQAATTPALELQMLS